MKKALLVLLLAGFVWSCNDDGDLEPTPIPKDTTKTVPPQPQDSTDTP